VTSGSPILARRGSASDGSGLSVVDGCRNAPRHVAIIMDGNGRWAKARRLPRIAGHRKGVEAVRSVVKAAPDLGVTTLTLYAFSSENWKRPAEEVSDLMGLLRIYLRNELADLHANQVRLKVIGDYRRLGPELVALIDGAVKQTADNAGLTLAIALNYGAQDEMARAAREIAADAAAGRLDPNKVDEALISSRLDTADLPPLDPMSGHRVRCGYPTSCCGRRLMPS
jgi:undecaprenyl diphosphate synthase